MGLIFEKESWQIKGAAYNVFTKLGSGFSEKVYQDALEIEFKHMDIPFEREKHLSITYRGEVLIHDYFADFICYDKIIVELKAVKEIEDAHKAQVLNYLRASNFKLGLLMNYHGSSCKIERILNYEILKKEKENAETT